MVKQAMPVKFWLLCCFSHPKDAEVQCDLGRSDKIIVPTLAHGDPSPSSNLFQALFENTTDAVTLFGEDGGIKLQNAAAVRVLAGIGSLEALLGCQAEDALAAVYLGKDWRGLVQLPNQYRHMSSLKEEDPVLFDALMSNTGRAARGSSGQRLAVSASQLSMSAAASNFRTALQLAACPSLRTQRGQTAHDGNFHRRERLQRSCTQLSESRVEGPPGRAARGASRLAMGGLPLRPSAGTVANTRAQLSRALTSIGLKGFQPDGLHARFSSHSNLPVAQPTAPRAHSPSGLRHPWRLGDVSRAQPHGRPAALDARAACEALRQDEADSAKLAALLLGHEGGVEATIELFVGSMCGSSAAADSAGVRRGSEEQPRQAGVGGAAGGMQLPAARSTAERACPAPDPAATSSTAARSPAADACGASPPRRQRRGASASRSATQLAAPRAAGQLQAEAGRPARSCGRHAPRVSCDIAAPDRQVRPQLQLLDALQASTWGALVGGRRRRGPSRGSLDLAYSQAAGGSGESVWASAPSGLRPVGGGRLSGLEPLGASGTGLGLHRLASAATGGSASPAPSPSPLLSPVHAALHAAPAGGGGFSSGIAGSATAEEALLRCAVPSPFSPTHARQAQVEAAGLAAGGGAAGVPVPVVGMLRAESSGRQQPSSLGRLLDLASRVSSRAPRRHASHGRLATVGGMEADFSAVPGWGMSVTESTYSSGGSGRPGRPGSAGPAADKELSTLDGVLSNVTDASAGGATAATLDTVMRSDAQLFDTLMEACRAGSITMTTGPALRQAPAWRPGGPPSSADGARSADQAPEEPNTEGGSHLGTTATEGDAARVQPIATALARDPQRALAAGAPEPPHCARPRPAAQLPQRAEPAPQGPSALPAGARHPRDGLALPERLLEGGLAGGDPAPARQAQEVPIQHRFRGTQDPGPQARSALCSARDARERPSPSADMALLGTLAERPLEVWHEVVVHGLVDPGSGERLVAVVQHDVSARVWAEQQLARVVEAEHALLEGMFPVHVLEHIAVMTAPRTDVEGSSEEEGDEDGSHGQPHGAVPSTVPRAPRGRPPAPDGAPPITGDTFLHLATSHSALTVLFADIQGFTSMCGTVRPGTVMAFLNALFTRLDALLDAYGVYKVETIGDCYMVAGGLMRTDEATGAVTVRGEDVDPRHADRTVQFAKALLRAASCVALPTSGEPVRLRVGIHSGPAMSGVVGTRMPRFCLFGDTVNTASRMESTGQPGAIHVSDATRRLVPGEDWQPTGGVQAKGKGTLETWLLHP